MNCPLCKQSIDERKAVAHINEYDKQVIERYHKKLGSKGGKSGTGGSKARTTEQARRAALVRWEGKNKKPLNNGKKD